MCLINTGTASACVRQRGESIFNLTWATPDATLLITNWRVMVDVETLSNHRYIEMSFASASPEMLARRRERRRQEKRWSASKLNSNRLTVATSAETRSLAPGEEPGEAEYELAAGHPGAYLRRLDAPSPGSLWPAARLLVNGGDRRA